MAGLSHSNRIPFKQSFLDLYDALRLNMIFMRRSKRLSFEVCLCKLEFKGTAIRGLAPSVGSCRNRKKTFPSGGAFPRKQSIVIAGSFKHSLIHLNFVYFTRRIQDIKKNAAQDSSEAGAAGRSGHARPFAPGRDDGRGGADAGARRG